MSEFNVQNDAVNISVNTVDYNNGESETLSSSGIINVNIPTTFLINTIETYSITLPSPIIPGYQKTIMVTQHLSVNPNITLYYSDGYGNSQQLVCGAIGDTITFISTTLGWNILFNSITINPVVVTISSEAPDSYGNAILIGNVLSQGDYPVIARGVVYNRTGFPTLPIDDSSASLSPAGVGRFEVTFHPTPEGYQYFTRAYATTSKSVVYGDILTVTTRICLAAGTHISLEDGKTKLIEDIEYFDMLKVWNFDDGVFDKAKPLWIKVKETANRYNLLTFSDGSTLKTINQHRIFNKDLGKFTHTMSEDTPIGTRTFSLDGDLVFLRSRKIINEPIAYYNIISVFHMNIFANGILTSCRYNNIYPIHDMKFVKDLNRKKLTISDYPAGISIRYFSGMRLSEQEIDPHDTIAYIDRLVSMKKH